MKKYIFLFFVLFTTSQAYATDYYSTWSTFYNWTDWYTILYWLNGNWVDIITNWTSSWASLTQSSFWFESLSWNELTSAKAYYNSSFQFQWNYQSYNLSWWIVFIAGNTFTFANWPLLEQTAEIENTEISIYNNAFYTPYKKYCFYLYQVSVNKLLFKEKNLNEDCESSVIFEWNTVEQTTISNIGNVPNIPWQNIQPPNIPWVSCKLIEIPTLSSTVWWDDFFENPFSAVGSGTILNQDWTVKSQVKFAESANSDFSDYDRFTATDVQYVSSLYTGSLTYPWTIKSNLSPWAWANWWLYIANFTSDRNGTRRPWNVLQIFGADTGFFGNFGYLQDFQTRDTTKLEYDGSGTVTFLSGTPVRDFAIQTVWGFNGMRIWLATKSTYYECSGSNGNLCQLNAIATWSGVECKGETTAEGIEYGQCEWKSWNVCAPITQSGVVVAPLPLPWQAYTVDGSGAITYTPYYIPWADIDTKGLFDCSYSDWTDSVGCIKEILWNISDSISKGNESLVWGNNAINQTIQSVGKNQTWSLDISLVSATGANLIDDIFRGSWNQAMWWTDFFGELGRFALYGALLCLVVLIILLIISANKK